MDSFSLPGVSHPSGTGSVGNAGEITTVLVLYTFYLIVVTRVTEISRTIIALAPTALWLCHYSSPFRHTQMFKWEDIFDPFTTEFLIHPQVIKYLSDHIVWKVYEFNTLVCSDCNCDVNQPAEPGYQSRYHTAVMSVCCTTQRHCRRQADMFVLPLPGHLLQTYMYVCITMP